jgi:hypothetical protein
MGNPKEHTKQANTAGVDPCHRLAAASGWFNGENQLDSLSPGW